MTLLCLGLLTLVFTGTSAWAQDGDSDAAPPDEGANALYDVIVAFEFGAIGLVLSDDGSVEDSNGVLLGEWKQTDETNDFAVTSDGAEITLAKIVGSQEAEIGNATLSTGGGSLDGFYMVTAIHAVQVGTTVYSPEFADGFEMTGDFDVEMIDDEEHYVAISACTVEVFTNDGESEFVDVPAGSDVFWNVDGGQALGLAVVIQDPQGGGLRRRRVPPQRAISSPALYAAGVWLQVSQQPGGCFSVTPTGADCRLAGTGCAIIVMTVVPGGGRALHQHSGACNKASNLYRENATGSLSVTF